MAAIITDISTKLVLTLDAGSRDGKMITRRITINGISGDASADALLEAVRALKKVLRHPVAAIRLHTVSTIESDAGQEKAEGAEEAALTERRLPEGWPMAYGAGHGARRLAMATAGRNRRHRPEIASTVIPEGVTTAARTHASNLRPPSRATTAALTCRYGEAVHFCRASPRWATL